MNSTFTNIALFIKRAEEYHTKEFIVNVFDFNNIGKVKDVKFIKKYGDYGKNYYGVIVIFERWNMNQKVQKLFNEMTSSSDGTTKFYFEYNRYWIINVHKQQLQECQQVIATVEPSLSDKDKIDKLEELVKSMSAQIYYMQNNNEKTERIIMDLEFKDTHHNLVNEELRYQLDLKNWEKDELNKEINKLRAEKFNGLL